MPLREMKWRASRGLTFGAHGSKAPSGLNPGTRLAASLGDGESRLGRQRSRSLGGLRGRVGVWSLGSLLITMVLKCLQAVVGLALSWWFLMLLFLALGDRFGLWASWNDETDTHLWWNVCACIWVLMYNAFTVIRKWIDGWIIADIVIWRPAQRAKCVVFPMLGWLMYMCTWGARNIRDAGI